jgi:hypothetical protein
MKKLCQFPDWAVRALLYENLENLSGLHVPVVALRQDGKNLPWHRPVFVETLESAKVTETKALAFSYELATAIDSSRNYVNWEKRLTELPPSVSMLAVRNLKPLVTERTISSGQLLAAIGRAFCTPENSRKKIDPNLANAIVDEIMKVLKES